MRPASCETVLRSCDRPHSSRGVGSVLRTSSNFHLPCGKQSFGAGCCACAVSSKYPEFNQAPQRVGIRFKFKVISATCEVGKVPPPDSHALKDFRPPSECDRRLTQRFTPRFSKLSLEHARGLAVAAFLRFCPLQRFSATRAALFRGLGTAIRLQGFPQTVETADKRLSPLQPTIQFTSPS